jgi:hypothetical protein
VNPAVSRFLFRGNRKPAGLSTLAIATSGLSISVRYGRAQYIQPAINREAVTLRQHLAVSTCHGADVALATPPGHLALWAQWVGYYALHRLGTGLLRGWDAPARTCPALWIYPNLVRDCSWSHWRCGSAGSRP